MRLLGSRAGRHLMTISSVFAILAMVATPSGIAGAAGAQSRSLATQGKLGPPLTMAVFGSWTNSWTTNEFSPSFLSLGDGLALLPLAFPTPKFGKYIPELATSWKMAPGSITIHLRKNAKWQDGRPFTSKDVVDTFLLQGANGNQAWASITSLTAPNAHTVALKLRSGSSPLIVLNDLIEIYPVPASEYHRFVIPHLAKDLIAQDGPGGSPNKAVSTALVNLEKFSPKKLIGDGPFRLTKVTTTAARMDRWAGWWDAKDVHISTIDSQSFSDESNFYPALYGHQMDLAQASIPGNVKQHWTSEPQSGYVSMNNFAQSGIYFNDRKYPLNLLGVRKALAYLIDRKKMTYLDSGNAPQGPWVKYPDGVIAPQTSFLTKAQEHSLNPYLPSTKKATHILHGLGFTKKGGQWYTPKGKRLTFSIVAPSGWTNSIQDTIVVASELTKFGIKTTASVGEQPGYWTNMTDGNFDLIWGWGGFGTDPLDVLSYVFGTYDYTGPSEPGIGYGPMATVPGLGKVNLHTVITNEAANIAPGPKMNQLVWTWAKYVNKNLPYLSTWDKYQQVEFSKQNYTHWPKASSWIWQVAGVTWPGVLTVAMQHGFVRPR